MPKQGRGKRKAPPEPEDWRIFSPTIDDSGATYARLHEAARLPSPEAVRRLAEIARAAATRSGLAAHRAKAAALVLRDLIAMGWQVRTDAQWIYVRPGVAGTSDPKDAIRRQLEFGRNDQLGEVTVRRAIMRLERPTRFAKVLPITELIADGRRLARQLEPIAALPRGERAAALAGVCDPYLQVVEQGVRDEHTGIKLTDIWRYFRYTWASRYRKPPGRNILYLIRDAAQPRHPVMAIAALSNAVMQLTRRDDVLGWTRDGLRALLGRGDVSDAELFSALRARIEEDLGQIYVDDLPLAGGVPDVITDDLLDRLALIEAQSGGVRTEKLREDEEDDDDVPQRIKDVLSVDLVAMARTPLYRAKRALELRELLRALRAFRACGSITAMWGNTEGDWAIGFAIEQLKKRYSATSMMEITTCGAVPPYGHLLGGKLACLMMTSPQIVRDYATRYGGAFSIIKSQIAARPILKDPSLVYLGTTSLYTGSSSQYNRVALPLGTVEGQRAAVTYDYLGESQGYGSPNLSKETETTLAELTEATREYRNVNFVYGEGQSPKMRQLREGFAALGLDRTDVLHHGSNRIIYAVPLVKNVQRFLLGVDREPTPSIPWSADATAAIAAFWRTRWLASRLDHKPALEALARSTPLTERVSRLIPEAEPVAGQMRLFATPRQRDEEPPMPTVVAEDEKITFIRQLYRDESAYSDHVKIGRLRELNVRTKLDDIVRRIVRAGGSVVITGNAGDGKTHTIRLLESDLKQAGAHVIVDASELPQDEVLAQWEAARAKDQPFCIAINEGPLVELIRHARGQHPWLEEIQAQLLRLVRYVPVEEEDQEERYQPERGKTVVMDLSLRRTLAPDLVRRIVDKLTDEAWYGACPTCPAVGTCSVKFNRAMLRTAQVQDRLVGLVDQVAERGVKATFREVLSFGSYLIFGGRTCAELARDGGSEQTRYYWNAFEGQGVIFESVELGLDPVRQTNARVDEDLWRGRYEPADFVGNEPLPVVPRNLDEVQQYESQEAADSFAALKRRWYFEHKDGHLSHATPADKWFAELQNNAASTQLRVGRLVGLINAWWNKADHSQQDRLRLWTRLSYSPRAQGKAMVSGRDVSSLQLGLFRPRLAPPLAAAFGKQAVDHLLLAPPGNTRFANLVLDRRLLGALLSAGVREQADEVGRRLTAFNDALAQHAEAGSHVRTIELVDPESELKVKIRVDLSQRRYDSGE